MRRRRSEGSPRRPCRWDADIGPADAPPDRYTLQISPGAPSAAFSGRPEGGRETPITGAASSDGRSPPPTVWKSRLAFARRYGPDPNASTCDRSTRRINAFYTRRWRPRRGLRFEGPAAHHDGVVASSSCANPAAQVIDFQLGTQARHLRRAQVRASTSPAARRPVESTICGLAVRLPGVSWAGSRLLYAEPAPAIREAVAARARSCPLHTLERPLEWRPAAPEVGFAATGSARGLAVFAPDHPHRISENYIRKPPTSVSARAYPRPRFTPARAASVLTDGRKLATARRSIRSVPRRDPPCASHDLASLDGARQGSAQWTRRRPGGAAAEFNQRRASPQTRRTAKTRRLSWSSVARRPVSTTIAVDRVRAWCERSASRRL